MDKTPKVWLTREETDSILLAAKKESYRDYLILTLCRYGLRIGEIVGRGTLPGIHGEDLRENGIWLVGKGYSHDGEAPSLYPLPIEFATILRDFSVKEGRGKTAKLFDVSVRQMERRIKSYAKNANVADWVHVRPHRLRAFFRDGPEREGIVSLPDSRHDATPERRDDKQVRWKDKLLKGIANHAKPRFWMIGALSAILTYHSYGILSGVYVDLNILSYDDTIVLGVLEAFLVVPLTILFLWKTLVWWHDKPKSSPHIFHDAGIVN